MLFLWFKMAFLFNQFNKIKTSLCCFHLLALNLSLCRAHLLMNIWWEYLFDFDNFLLFESYFFFRFLMNKSVWAKEVMKLNHICFCLKMSCNWIVGISLAEKYFFSRFALAFITSFQNIWKWWRKFSSA